MLAWRQGFGPKQGICSVVVRTLRMRKHLSVWSTDIALNHDDPIDNNLLKNWRRNQQKMPQMRMENGQLKSAIKLWGWLGLKS